MNVRVARGTRFDAGDPIGTLNPMNHVHLIAGRSGSEMNALDALVLPGEVTKFSGGVAGSTEQWQTQVRQIDRIDANTVLVEANMVIKLLNKETETGIAVYRLTKLGNAWKLSSVEMFEVR